MGYFINKRIKYFYLIIPVIFFCAAYYFYLKKFSYGTNSRELREKYNQLLENPDKFSIMDEIKRITIDANSINDKKLYIESYIHYYSARSYYGFKLEASVAFFNLLETNAEFLNSRQLFNIYGDLLSSNLEPYYFRGLIDSKIKSSLLSEINSIIDKEEDNNTKYYYFNKLYSMNIVRTQDEALYLESQILKFTTDTISTRKIINYRKALRCRAQKKYQEELKFMKLASIGKEPGVGELGVSFRNNNMLDSAEIYLLKSFMPSNVDKLTYYFIPSINLAKLYLKKQDFEKAESFIKRAEDFANQNLGEFHKSEILELRSQFNIERNLKDAAITNLKMEKDLVISQYYSYYRNNKMNAFIVNEVRSIRNSRFYLSILFFGVTMIIFIFFVLVINTIFRKYKISLVDKEKEIKKSSDLKQELNNAFNRFSELSHISEKKDQVIDSIISNKEVKKALTQKDIMLLNEIKSFTDSGHEWSFVKDNFHIHFPEFYHKLLTVNPSLTELELRYATYIKMGLSNIEIAAILGINIQSVATFKYRLKQRLNLSKNQSLLEFIIGV